MPAQSQRAAALRLTILQANDACDRQAQLLLNSPRLLLCLCDAQSLPATARFPGRSVPAAKNNPETQSPFFRSASALLQTSYRYKARVLRISPFLIPDAPAPPMCIAASSSQLRMRRREKPFRYGRCPLRSRAKLQFAGRPFETICKCRGQSIAAAARASISRESVLMQERDVECCDRSSKEQKAVVENHSRRLLAKNSAFVSYAMPSDCSVG